MTDQQITRLVHAAQGAMACSYGLGANGTRYGAAVLTACGHIYPGGVYKSETRTLTLHAEQVALAHAAAHGEFSIAAIAIVSNEDPSGERYTYPCGLCKQVLYESAKHAGCPMSVVLVNGRGHYESRDLSEFIVFPWP